jgi:hypothetical protein
MAPAHSVGRLVEAIVAPEDLVAEDDARHADHPEVAGALGRLAQPPLDRVTCDSGPECPRVQL